MSGPQPSNSVVGATGSSQMSQSPMAWPLPTSPPAQGHLQAEMATPVAAAPSEAVELSAPPAPQTGAELHQSSAAQTAEDDNTQGQKNDWQAVNNFTRCRAATAANTNVSAHHAGHPIL